MPSMTSKTLLAVLTGAASVVAHGHVKDIIINGVLWQGWDITVMPYQSSPPIVVGWETQQRDNGYIAPSNFTDPDIICHKDAKNARGHAVVAAGDKVFIQWTTWPESHRGPVIDYLASCGDAGCESVDKTALEFFKISEVGLIDSSSPPFGKWATDQLMANDNSWLVEIPPNVAPGFYVLRHELIALHGSGSLDGAQNYPQCFNLQVTGSGSDTPAGVPATKLYGMSDPGILIDIYQKLSTYIVPGPPLYTGAVSIVQSASVATATSSAVVGTEPAGGNGGGSGTAPKTTSTTTSKQPVNTNQPAPSSYSTSTTQPEYTQSPVSDQQPATRDTKSAITPPAASNQEPVKCTKSMTASPSASNQQGATKCTKSKTTPPASLSPNTTQTQTAKAAAATGGLSYSSGGTYGSGLPKTSGCGRRKTRRHARDTQG